MNPAPDAELASVGKFYNEWLVSAVTDLVFRRLAEPRPEQQYRWDALISPASSAGAGTQAFAAAASATDSVIPQSVRELPSDIANAVGEIVGQASGVVSGIVDAVTEAVTPDAESQPEAKSA